MATKSITITVEAYERLAANKAPSESFSDVINKLTRKRSLMELAGILSEKEAADLKKNVESTRKRLNREIEKRTR